MYSIPAPVIKTLLDYCDLPTAIIMARVTKRCNTVFRHYREEILIRCEYTNIQNMFRYCSDEFIIHMSKHEFFDKEEARKCCRQMRYQLYEKLGNGKLYWYGINEKLLREIYKNGDYNNIISGERNKLAALRLGIDLDIPYSDDTCGLHVALILQDKVMIDKLSKYGNFYTYCVTGYYHLADNYEVENVHVTINNSKEPIIAFNYIEKRGYKIKGSNCLFIQHYEVLKIIVPRIKKLPKNYCLYAKDYDSLMLICNKLLEFVTIDEIFERIAYINVNFTRYLLQKYKHLIYEIKYYHNRTSFIINLLDLVDNEFVMQCACKSNNFTLIRALVHCNGHEWAHKFDHPFIKKYYS